MCIGICVTRNHDDAGILACDGGKFSDNEVFIVYEDRHEHLHAETSKNGQLPMRLKINVAVEQYGRSKLGHTVQLKSYDIFSKGDIVQDIKYPNVLWYMHPALPGDVPTMVRFLKPTCKEKEAAEHLLHVWLLPWVQFLRESVKSNCTTDGEFVIDPLIHSSLGSVDSAGSMLQA